MRQDPDGGRDAVALLAAFIVLVLGVGFCTLIAVFVADQPQMAMLTVLGAFAGVVFIISLLLVQPRERMSERENGWLRVFAKPKPKNSYKLRRKNKARIEEFGTNKPPTAEQIRKIKEDVRNWSPGSGEG